MQKDFSYPLKVAELPLAAQHYELKAAGDNLAFLAEVLQVPAVKKLDASFDVKRTHGTTLIVVNGHIDAVLELESVVSLEKFTQGYDFDFEVVYDTAATYDNSKEDSWQDETPDVVVGGEINLADIAIEQVALKIDDYPRQEGEVFIFEPDFDPKAEERHNPFDMLAKLKK